MSLLKKKKMDYLNEALVDKNSLSKLNEYSIRTGDTKIKKSSLGYNDNFLEKLLGIEKKKPKPSNPKSKKEKVTALSKPKPKLFKKKGKDMTMWS